MRIESNPHIRIYKNVHYQCDSCGRGNMIFTGASFPISSPLYEHICSNCGARQNFSLRYPTETYEERKA